MLSVDGLVVDYGAGPVVTGLALEVKEGNLVALLGANGAGKSTTLNTIAGMVRPVAGSIQLLNSEIAGQPLHRVVRRGIALVPEGRMIVPTLTVSENLALSSFSRRKVPHGTERVFELFPVLANRRSQVSGLLSGGEQQMLAIARALMTGPEVLLLDEPSMGLSPVMLNEVFRAIEQLHEEGLTILLVEQNASKALPIADYAYVMDRGAIVMEGRAADLMGDAGVVRAYLGVEEVDS